MSSSGARGPVSRPIASAAPSIAPAPQRTVRRPSRWMRPQGQSIGSPPTQGASEAGAGASHPESLAGDPFRHRLPLPSRGGQPGPPVIDPG